jgi:hypothetical protein
MFYAECVIMIGNGSDALIYKCSFQSVEDPRDVFKHYPRCWYILWPFWYIVWPSGIFYVFLLYFSTFWYVVPIQIWQPWLFACNVGGRF